MRLGFLGMTAALLCGSPSLLQVAHAAPPLRPAPPTTEPVDEEPTLSLTGELVDRSSDAVTLEDDAGERHTFRVTEQTRYVYGANSSPSDLRRGARIRAEYAEGTSDPVALALWVLSGPH
jgi:hypothetical protein